jgi:hypothetical protein
MRALPIFWRDKQVGTVAVPDSFRPPMSSVELAAFSAVCLRSRSWLFDIRPGDFTVEERDGSFVLLASSRLGPGDIGCLAGFEAAEGHENFCDEEMIEIAAQVLREHSGGRG